MITENKYILQQCKFVGVRILLSWMILGWCQDVYASAHDPVSIVLTQNFDTQPRDVQKKVLRQVGLLQLEDASGFLIKVALSPLRYTQEVRKAALKGLLALDGKKYRPVLPRLQEDAMVEKKLLQTMQQVCGFRSDLEGWVCSIDFDEASWMLEAKMNYIFIAIRKGGQVRKSWLTLWDHHRAQVFLRQKVQSEKQSDAWQTLLDLLAK